MSEITKSVKTQERMHASALRKLKKTSKFISLILRHKPDAIDITLDEHGWADVQELIDGINRSGGHELDMDMLEEIVRTDEKQRYSFNEDHTLIRANQGHSRGADHEAGGNRADPREPGPFHSGGCGAGGEDPTGYSLAWYGREVRLFHR